MTPTPTNSAEMLATVSSAYEDVQGVLATMATLAEQARKSVNERATLDACIAAQRDQIAAFETNAALASRTIQESRSESESLRGQCAALKSREAKLEQQCEQLKNANANLRTMANRRQQAMQEAKEDASKQIATLTEENNRLRSESPNPDREKQNTLMTTTRRH